MAEAAQNIYKLAPTGVTTSEPDSHVQMSIIIPAYNNPQALRECLSALVRSLHPATEIIVVDDASTDDTPAVAAALGVRVLRHERNSGPAAARNYGGRQAQGDILFFVDADVILAPDAVSRVLQILAEHPEVAAVFGSYDASPRAQGVVSQYRNLLHHFVHQNSKPEASTFWAGCGAVRRSVFEALGGFDADRFRHPSIEDIELGYRLRQAGHRVLLDKALQGTHLKRWTFWSVLKTDIRYRGIPWARLILERKHAPDDLNLEHGQRVSGGLVMLAFLLLPLGMFRAELLTLPSALCLGVVAMNRRLYTFFYRQRGAGFAFVCIPLHLLYYLYSGLSYGFVWLEVQLRELALRRTKCLRRGRRLIGGNQ